MTDRELMQQALDVLEDIFGKNKIDVGVINRLRDRLAQPVQEPVAWMYVNTDGECEQIEYETPPDDPSITALYKGEEHMTKQCPSCGGICKPSGCERENVTQTWMNSRKWQGLTDEDVEEIERWIEFKEDGSGRIPNQKLVRYIERKLKEKNT